MAIKIDLSGKRIGRWQVIKECEYKKGNRIVYECKCDCGTERDICASILHHKSSLSCGCWKKEKLSERTKKHGLSRKNKPIYDAWFHMNIRCYNSKSKQFKNYGGRGIEVCEQWRNDFEAFYKWAIENGWHPGLSIDRINNNSNYEPLNCRWATDLQQVSNRRVSKTYDFFGEKWHLREIADTFFVDIRRLTDRVYKGWPLKNAIFGKKEINIWD